MKPLGPSTPSARWALATLSLAMLLSSLGTSIANVALPTLAESFDASFREVQWVVLAYLLAITALIVGAGRLGDVMGRRRLMLAGLALFTAASVLCGLAPTLPLLVAARVAQGLGAATMMALTMAFVAESVPMERTGSAMGLLGAMSAAGTALGPSLGGLLIAGFGWRSIFLINLPLGVTAFVLAHRYLPAGSSAASPRMEWAMLRDPVLGAGLATSALVTTVVMATLVVGPFYLSGALLLSAARVGLVMSCGPIVAAFTGVPAGRLVDRWGAHRMSIAGLTAMTVGASTLPELALRFGVAGYIGALMVITAGYSLFQAANNTAVMTNVRAEQRGVTSGMLNLSRNLGLIAGASLMGAVFTRGAGTTDIRHASAEAVAAGMRMTFAVAAGLIVLAMGIAVAAASGARARRGSAAAGLSYR